MQSCRGGAATFVLVFVIIIRGLLQDVSGGFMYDFVNGGDSFPAGQSWKNRARSPRLTRSSRHHSGAL